MSAAGMYPEIAALMGSSVVVQSQSTTDAFGKRTFAARGNSPYKCYPVFATQRVWSIEGREESTSVTLYIDADDIAATDSFVYEGRTYRCLSVETWRNETNQIVGQVAYLQ